MKTQLNHCKKQGSVLVVTMCILAIALMAMAGYLYTVQYEVGAVDRSQTWNSAISLAEAGMEEGMATVNYSSSSIGATNVSYGSSSAGASAIITDPYSWTNALATDTNWVVTGGTNATLKRYVYGSNYYIVNISWSGTNAPTVTSAGVVSYTAIPWAFSSLRQHSFLAAAGSGTGGSSYTNTVTMGRKIKVSTVLSPLFSAAIVCKSTFDMKGNNTRVDSFNSMDGTHNTLGQYDVTKCEANGNVGTDSVITNSLTLGNGNIFGSVYTGPGTSQSCVSIGSQGSVGDLAWASNSTGIEPGHWKGNYNMYIPDVAAPDTTGWASSLPAGSGNTNILMGGTNYVLASLSSPLVIAGNTTIWVKGSCSLGVTISNNAQLILYVGNTTGTTTLGWSGKGTFNMPGLAANLQIYGLPSLTSVDLHGNAGYVCTLYAPEAAFTGGGSGNNNQDTSGAMVVNSISLKGHWNFHYDESLQAAGPSRGWIATGWKEVSYTPQQ